MNTRFFLQSASYGRGVDLRLVSLNRSGDIDGEAMPAIFKKIDEGQMWAEPFQTIHRDSAQNLMDELWNLGFRPERGQMSVGQVAAIEKHLEDMRAITFAKLEVAKP